jgi:hypothetical protein
MGAFVCVILLDWNAMLDYSARGKMAIMPCCLVVLALYLDILGSFSLLTHDMCYGAANCPD